MCCFIGAMRCKLVSVANRDTGSFCISYKRVYTTPPLPWKFAQVYLAEQNTKYLVANQFLTSPNQIQNTKQLILGAMISDEDIDSIHIHSCNETDYYYYY